MIVSDEVLLQTTLHFENLFSPFNQLLGDQPFMCSVFPLIMLQHTDAKKQGCVPAAYAWDTLQWAQKQQLGSS